MTTAHVGTARDALGHIDVLKMERCTQCHTACVDDHLSGIGCTRHCPCPLLSDLYCPACCPCCNDTAQLVLVKAADGQAGCRQQEGHA
ncbi:MAG: hypothetical protein ETSY1_37480 [Candidatus Entotheonella factor]|uniref:Uncharacterized protein n=1 Tax=Entotheonella factor TaxID=1429438 RepID=W4L700_ENTF1|nr:MAG: hypothetical protein ETSY1_37480 [Candidatus Entotheonella factor]